MGEAYRPDVVADDAGSCSATTSHEVIPDPIALQHHQLDPLFMTPLMSLLALAFLLPWRMASLWYGLFIYLAVGVVVEIAIGGLNTSVPSCGLASLCGCYPLTLWFTPLWAI